jgi:hypothetical protein
MKTLLAALFVALILVTGATGSILASQQTRDTPAATTPVPAGHLTITGTIVADDSTSQPVRRVIVTLTGGELTGERTTATDDAGHFAFGHLSAGHYELKASKPGWITSYYGSKHPGRAPFGGAPIILTTTDEVTSLTLRLLRGSVVTGTLRDPTGRPMVNVNVMLEPVHVVNGQRVQDSPNDFPDEDETDDRGVYRLYGIKPGDYIVSAISWRQSGDGLLQLSPGDIAAARRAVQAGSGVAPGAAPSGSPPSAGSPVPPPTTLSYATVFFPGTFEMSNATVLTIGPSEERSGVDFIMTLAPAARVRGTVVEPDGRPAIGGQVQLVPIDDSGAGRFYRIGGDAPISGDGTFTITDVTPGPYHLIARARDSSPPTAAPPTQPGVVVIGRMGGGAGSNLNMWAEQSVTMNGEDIAGLTLALEHGATVAGLIKFSGALAPPQDLRALRLRLTPADPSAADYLNVPFASVDPSGAFRFDVVPPGRYRVTVPMFAGRGGNPGANALLKGWLARSAQIGNTDALDAPFEVVLGATQPEIVLTFTDRLAQISGRVSNASGQPLANYRDLHVVVFSADRSLWGAQGRRLKAPVSLDPDGTYRVEDLPAGDYFLAAVIDMDERDLSDVAFLTDLSKAAIPVTLRDGEQKVQNLAIPGRF